MPIVIGGLNVRTAAESYTFSVSLDDTGVFDSTPMTSASVAVTPTTSPALTLGAVSVSDNVATFRVSAGATGHLYLITITGTNATDTVVRSVLSETR